MRRSALFAVIFAAATQSLAAQAPIVQQAGAPNEPKRYTFEFSGGIGFTSVDKNKWATGVALDDWNQMGYAADARLFFANAGPAQFGAEAGYRYFWYYEALYAGTRIYRDVAATRLGAVARLPIAQQLAFDLGGAVYVFDGFTDPGVSAALVYQVPAGPITLPLHFRTDVVMDSDAMMIHSGITLGFGVKF